MAIPAHVDAKIRSVPSTAVREGRSHFQNVSAQMVRRDFPKTASAGSRHAGGGRFVAAASVMLASCRPWNRLDNIGREQLLRSILGRSGGIGLLCAYDWLNGVYTPPATAYTARMRGSALSLQRWALPVTDATPQIRSSARRTRTSA